MSEKDIYIEKLNQQLDYWSSEIKILELKAENASEAIRDQTLEKLEALKQFFDATEGTLDGWAEASEEAWESIEDRAEHQLETAHAAMKTALDHIRGLLPSGDRP